MQKMTEEEKRDMIAEIVGRRLGITKKAIENWMDKHQIYDFGWICSLVKNNIEKFVASVLEAVKI